MVELQTHDSLGYAAITVVECLIEHLVETNVIIKESSNSIYERAAELNDIAAENASRPEINKGAADVIRAIIASRQ